MLLNSTWSSNTRYRWFTGWPYIHMALINWNQFRLIDWAKMLFSSNSEIIFSGIFYLKFCGHGVLRRSNFRGGHLWQVVVFGEAPSSLQQIFGRVLSWGVPFGGQRLWGGHRLGHVNFSLAKRLHLRCSKFLAGCCLRVCLLPDNNFWQGKLFAEATSSPKQLLRQDNFFWGPIA